MKNVMFTSKTMLVWGALLMLIGLSCKKGASEAVAPFDPGRPVEISNFYPDSGGVRTQFIINGENFGTDPSKINVYFEGEENGERSQRKAVVISAKGEVIYCMVPKQSSGMKTLRVEITDGEQSQDATFGAGDTEKSFRYIVASSVSTVSGKAKEAGNKNGTLAEATFSRPRYVVGNSDGDFFVVDFNSPNTIRLMSIKENMIKNVYQGQLCGMPVFDKEAEALFAPIDHAPNGYLRFVKELDYTTEPMGKAVTAGYQHSLAIIPDPSGKEWIYVRINTGNLIRFPKKIQGKISADEVQIVGMVRNRAQNGHLLYNPHDGYLYITLHNDHSLGRIKINHNTADPSAPPTCEYEQLSSARRVGGYEDGDLDLSGNGESNVLFNQPRGMAIDKDGMIYIADCQNHCIRKFNPKNGSVSTLAGVPRKSGYKDGPLDEARFNVPYSVGIDKDDFLYIADSENHCIRKIAIE